MYHHCQLQVKFTSMSSAPHARLWVQYVGAKKISPALAYMERRRFQVRRGNFWRQHWAVWAGLTALANWSDHFGFGSSLSEVITLSSKVQIGCSTYAFLSSRRDLRNDEFRSAFGQFVHTGHTGLHSRANFGRQQCQWTWLDADMFNFLIHDQFSWPNISFHQIFHMQFNYLESLEDELFSLAVRINITAVQAMKSMILIGLLADG